MAAGSEEAGQGGARPRVLLANINRGQVNSAFMVAVIQSLQADVIHGMVAVESGPYLDDGRNKAVANALQLPDWEWLLFVDSDVEFTPQHVIDLLAPYATNWLDGERRPVIGGVYVNPFPADEEIPGEEEADGRVGPVVYEWVERTDLPGDLNQIPTWNYRRMSRKALASLEPVGGIEPVCKVDCIGTGFLAIHRSLLTLMEQVYNAPLPWFHEPVLHDVHYGEDMGFCLRLADLGYPVLAHRGVTPLHHKTMKLI